MCVHACARTAYARSYVGAFADDKMEGRGMRFYADGSKYVGDFVAGLRDGQGSITDAAGKVRPPGPDARQPPTRACGPRVPAAARALARRQSAQRTPWWAGRGGACEPNRRRAGGVCGRVG